MRSSRIVELRAQERYAQDKLRLYRARVYGARAIDPARMRDLERDAAGATARLRHALDQRDV